MIYFTLVDTLNTEILSELQSFISNKPIRYSRLHSFTALATELWFYASTPTFLLLSVAGFLSE